MSVATASSPNYDVPRPSAESTLRLECWYHGLLTRVRAESLVRAEGDFLVRDSISSKGDFVLTVFWKGRAIHFQINRIHSSSSSTGFLFQFEDEQFESVSDLISFYQSHRRAVTLSSGCTISNPVPKTAFVNDSQPYKEIEQNYVKMFFPQTAKHGIDRCLSQQVLLNQACKFLNRASSVSNVDVNATSSTSPKEHMTLSALLNRPLPIPQRSPLQDDQSEYCEMDYDSMEPMKAPTAKSDDILDASTSSLARRLEHSSLTSLSSVKDTALNSNPISQSCQDITRRNSKLHWRLPRTDSAPSLPARKQSLPVRDSGCVADSSDYDQPRPSHCADRPTLIDAVQYRSSLIDDENRPQTKELFEKFKSLLLKHTPEQCAALITYEDRRLLRFKRAPNSTEDARQCNGIALLLLPQGFSMRADLIERSRSLQFLCVLSILNGNRIERCCMLSAWIHIAHALIKVFGNAFSYLTIMSALRSKTISSIVTLWTDLEPAVSERFHLELAPSVQRLIECGTLPKECSEVTVPCVQPLLDLLSSSPSSTFLNTSSLSAQIESLWKWLEMGREWALNSDRFEEAASAIYTQPATDHDNFLSTEFSLRFLFGARGCSTDARIRYQKLAAVVDAVAERARLSQ
uniref:Breast cancer anti-estrogen resistance protein 3 n=1 Tax=Ascaris suum TaxID=6253 RepID=F1KWC0_ASCSU